MTKVLSHAKIHFFFWIEVVDEDYSSSYDPVEAIPVDFIPDSPRGRIPTYSDEEIVEESFSFSSEVNEALDDLLAGTDLIEHDLVPEFIKATAVRNRNRNFYSWIF